MGPEAVDALGYAERVRLVIDLLQFVGFGVMIGVAIANMKAQTKRIEEMSRDLRDHVGDDTVHCDSRDIKFRLHSLESRKP